MGDYLVFRSGPLHSGLALLLLLLEYQMTAHPHNAAALAAVTGQPHAHGKGKDGEHSALGVPSLGGGGGKASPSNRLSFELFCSSAYCLLLHCAELPLSLYIWR